MSWRVNPRGPPHGQGGRRSGSSSSSSVEVVAYGSTVVPGTVTPHLMSRDPGRPVKTRGPSHGQGGCCSSSSSCIPQVMGRDPGRTLKTRRPPHGLCLAAHRGHTSHGPRPGPVHQVRDDGLRPGLAHPFKSFRTMGRGPAHRISGCRAAARPVPSHLRSFTARPGPVHHFFKVLGAARPGLSHFQNTRPGLIRPITIFRSARPGPAWTTGP